MFSISVIHGFDKLDGGAELHPPVLFLAMQPFLIETGDVLDRAEQHLRVGFDEDEDEHRHEVIGGWHRLLIGHAQEVHYRRRTSQHALKFVLGRLQQIHPQ